MQYIPLPKTDEKNLLSICVFLYCHRSMYLVTDVVLFCKLLIKEEKN